MELALDRCGDFADLRYLKSACLYALGRRNEAATDLQRALLQNDLGYEVMFELAPHLRNDEGVMNIIEQYKN
jgi:hypothetical protein